jgi:predicted DNA-binding antitoxin AbrB/MazE fold protein
MSTQIPAIFSDGVFRPLVPVLMAEGTHVQVEVSDAIAEPAKATELQASWQTYLKQMESIVDDSPTAITTKSCMGNRL